MSTQPPPGPYELQVVGDQNTWRLTADAAAQVSGAVAASSPVAVPVQVASGGEEIGNAITLLLNPRALGAWRLGDPDAPDLLPGGWVKSHVVVLPAGSPGGVYVLGSAPLVPGASTEPIDTLRGGPTLAAVQAEITAAMTSGALVSLPLTNGLTLTLGPQHLVGVALFHPASTWPVTGLPVGNLPVTNR